ncbi:hypothetical protein ACFWVM_08515 [Nocardia fluminea]
MTLSSCPVQAGKLGRSLESRDLAQISLGIVPLIYERGGGFGSAGFL